MTIIISCFPLSYFGGPFAFIGQLAGREVNMKQGEREKWDRHATKVPCRTQTRDVVTCTGTWLQGRSSIVIFDNTFDIFCPWIYFWSKQTNLRHHCDLRQILNTIFFSIFLYFCWLKSSQISNCGPISFTKTLTKSKKKTFALLSLFLNSCFQW